MSDTGLKLNFDILLMLMDYVDRKDVLSLMQTCHFMYVEGIPALLRYPVVLSYERDFGSFCEFMLASPFIRPRYLRELIMGSTARFPKELVNRLVLVLTRAEGLEKFTIACENDPSEAAVMAALAATTSITHLSIESPNATVAQVLQEWKSAVTKVAVSFDERRLIGQSDDFRMRNLDPTWIFAPLAHSVREMQAIWPRYFSANIVFPAVDTLQVHAYRPAALSATMRAFPHLRRLIVSFEMGFDPDKLLRERHENEVGEESEHWRRLEYVQGDVGSVYVCSLPCTVEHLDLTVPHRCRNADVLIPAVAGAAQPTRLDLHFIENCVHLEPLEAALRAAASFVTHLDIIYRVPCDDVKIRYIIVSTSLALET